LAVIFFYNQAIVLVLGVIVMLFLLLIVFLLLPVFGRVQNAPKVRMAYTSINIQMTPIYLMKDLDLARTGARCRSVDDSG
jgi:hypothetical protein